jgi:ubiquinol-cytochrome c reductase cytochrome b subunit
MCHFKDPQSVSPGSIMPKVLLQDEELKELTDYMMSLK